MKDRARSVALCAALALTLGAGVLAQQDAATEKVAKIKQSFQASMAALRGYEWIETTTVKLDGEQKSQKQNRCYYGADGKEQKVPIGDQSAGETKSPRGIRGRIAESKKEDMEDYVHKATALIQQYVPPDPQKLQAVKDKGAQTMEVLDNATRLRVTFPGYLKPGDALHVDVDPNADRIKGVFVSTYIDSDTKDVIKLDVAFGAFQDGTTYPSKITMHGESKKLDVVVENSGYRKAGS
jgi:hypothetical protein